MDEKQSTELRERITVLREKVQRIKDGNDIKRLQRIFGYYFDRGLWDEMADLFSDHTVGRGGEGGIRTHDPG